MLLPVWLGCARQLELGKGGALECLDLTEDVPAENDRGDEMSELGGDRHGSCLDVGRGRVSRGKGRMETVSLEVKRGNRIDAADLGYR